MNLEINHRDKLIIDCGHYTYTKGPSELDIALFQHGATLYKKVKSTNTNTALAILVDDMEGISSNSERRKLNINQLPQKYFDILKNLELSSKEVTIVSQNKMREKGKKWLRERNKSRSTIGQCELIVAAMHRWKELQGYTATVLLYEPEKTAHGITLTIGLEKAKELFSTKITAEVYLFETKETYKKI